MPEVSCTAVAIQNSSEWALLHVSLPPAQACGGEGILYVFFNISWTPWVLDPITNPYLGPPSWLHPVTHIQRVQRPWNDLSGALHVQLENHNSTIKVMRGTVVKDGARKIMGGLWSSLYLFKSVFQNRQKLSVNMYYFYISVAESQQNQRNSPSFPSHFIQLSSRPNDKNDMIFFSHIIFSSF